MKELENNNSTKVEIHQEQNQKQEYKFIGRVHLIHGCKLWSYNPEKDEMKEVKAVGKASISLDGNVNTKREAQYNPKYIYFQAINEKNARRKLEKYKNGNYKVAENFEEKKFESLPY